MRDTRSRGFFTEKQLRERSIQIERATAELVMNVTEDLLVAAEQRGMSNADLARAVGVSRSNVQRQLSGDRNMTLRTLARLAGAMGLKARVNITAPDKAKRVARVESFDVENTHDEDQPIEPAKFHLSVDYAFRKA